MRRITKFVTGAATVALVTLSTAAPAQYRYNRDHHDGISTGEAIAGVAVLGGVAAIIAAQSRDRGRYGYYYGDQYRNNYVAAVNACARYADRYGGGVQITDVDRRNANRYRVRGIVQGGYGGYDRYNRYGGYGYNGGYGGYGGYGRSFACTATDYGQITDFDLNGRDRY